MAAEELFDVVKRGDIERTAKLIGDLGLDERDRIGASMPLSDAGAVWSLNMAFIYACMGGHLEIAQMLVDAGANVILTDAMVCH